MDYDDLKYRFDFNRISMPDLMQSMTLARLSDVNPVYKILADSATWELARKASVRDVNTIPADMLPIFLAEFVEAFKEWSQDVGLVGRE